jgi:multidrug efflux pump subunit AcrA (membrane-fusion protein)
LFGAAISYAVATNGADAHRYVTATVERGTVAQQISLGGTVSKENQADASFLTSGDVTQVLVGVGDSVEAGQLLAVMDEAVLQQAVDTARANRDQAKQTYEQLSQASDLTANAPSLSDILGSGSAEIMAQLSGAQGQITAALQSLNQAQQTLQDAMTALNQACGQLPLDPGDWPTDWPTVFPTPTPSATPSSTASVTPSPSASVTSSASASASSENPIVPAENPIGAGESSSSASSSEPVIATESSAPASSPESGAPVAAQESESPTETPSVTPTATAPTLPSFPNIDINDAVQCVTAVAQLYQAQLTLGGAMATAAQTMEQFMSALANWQPQLDEQALAGLATSLLGSLGAGTGLSGETAKVVAQVSLTRTEKALTEAEANLEGANLVAPITGVVATMPFTVGQTATPTQSVTILGSGGIQVTLNVSVAQMRLIKTGQPAQISQSGTGSVDGIVSQKALLPSTSALGSTGYKVLVAASGNATDVFLEGTGATVTITVDTTENSLMIPVSGVVPDPGAESGTVLKLDGTTATRVTVQLGSVGSTRIAITNGLAEGDQVVLADSDIPLPDILQTLAGG